MNTLKAHLSLLILFSFSILHAEKLNYWIASGDRGIYFANLDLDSGRLSAPELKLEQATGGFMCFHPTKDILYSYHVEEGNALALAYTVDNETGDIALLNKVDMGSGKGGAAHIGIDSKGTLLAFAHYGSAWVHVVSIAEDGSLDKLIYENQQSGSSVNANRQQKSHPHWAGFNPDGTVLHVPDLGTDHVWNYAIDRESMTVEFRDLSAVTPGGGPRHMTFSTDYEFAYVNLELTNAVTVFKYDAPGGTLTPIQEISTLGALDQPDFNTTSQILVHPNNRFLFVGNRGHDSVAVFARDQKSGLLTPVEREHARGHWPRNFNYAPNGKWLIVGGQSSNTLASLAVDDESGNLTHMRGNIANVPSPLCILFR